VGDYVIAGETSSESFTQFPLSTFIAPEISYIEDRYQYPQNPGLPGRYVEFDGLLFGAKLRVHRRRPRAFDVRIAPCRGCRFRAVPSPVDCETDTPSPVLPALLSPRDRSRLGVWRMGTLAWYTVSISDSAACQASRGEYMISIRAATWLLVLTAAVIAAIALALPPIPQPQWYHVFADQRRFWGIPNFNNVVSNLPFAAVGLGGLLFLKRAGSRNGIHFLDRRESWPYWPVFTALALTATGSSYYHLHPDNRTLVWDRLPLVIVFMSLLAAIVAERISLRAGLLLMPVLLLIGVASVWQWRVSEVRGAGDLRFYSAVQLYSVLFLLVALFLPSRYTRRWDLAIVVGLYVLAKILEALDRPIFELGHVVSGHTLKHLAAAGAGYWIVRMLQKRRPLDSIG